MAQHKIRLTQVFRVERTITNALADSPGFDDPRWNETWSLQSEEVAPAADTPHKAS